MFIVTNQQNMIVNSEFVERFLIVEKPDASLIIASYNDIRPPITLGRYEQSESKSVLSDLYSALLSDQAGFVMPDSILYYQQKKVKDARTARKGGS